MRTLDSKTPRGDPKRYETETEATGLPSLQQLEPIRMSYLIFRAKKKKSLTVAATFSSQAHEA